MTAFPWKVGPMLAMTIGAWALGTAASAAMAGSTSRLDRIVGQSTYLWLFGALQGLVVLLFLDRLQAGRPLAWPYLLGLAALVLSAVVGLVDAIGRRPDLRGPLGAVPAWMKATALGLGGFTALLALGTLIAGAGGQVATGGYFPEEVTLFSVRAFCAFFASTSGSALVLLLARNPRPYFELATSGLVLVAAILVAALLFWDEYDLAARPGGAIYLDAYVIATVAFALIWLYGKRRPDLFSADPFGT